MTPDEVGQPSGAARQPEHPDKPAPDESLSTFFRVLAASFAHARDQEGARRTPRAARNQVKEPGHRLGRQFWPRPMVAAAAICVVLIWVTPLLLPAREFVVPDTLVGSWRTSARLYSDRGFTITKTSLVLKAGPDRSSVSVHPITGLKIARSGDGPVYTIEYLIEGAAYEFPLRVWSGPPQMISLVNQPAVVWQREDGKFSPSPQPANRR